MEFNSKYYNDFISNMNEHQISPDAYEYAFDIQLADELMFAFNMFLLV